ncbi:hypothetical protein BKA65DRAFT_547056 [Rhexocercosporidium sp. MPI-PUGE-AT-0058]|nr:hypothetical protein BKA65DRAFT_547056 [Rhexocercosporidium sp. MPI-PUGE-AT-0058]
MPANKLELGFCELWILIVRPDSGLVIGEEDQDADMFKEVVSLAIILGFIWNILYVEHPDTRSYTIAFAGSLLALSPFVLGWIYWSELKTGATPREILRWRYWRQSSRRTPIHDAQDDREIRLGLVRGVRSGSVSDVDDGTESRTSADVEKGLGSPASNVES